MRQSAHAPKFTSAVGYGCGADINQKWPATLVRF